MDPHKHCSISAVLGALTVAKSSTASMKNRARDVEADGMVWFCDGPHCLGCGDKS